MEDQNQNKKFKLRFKIAEMSIFGVTGGSIGSMFGPIGLATGFIVGGLVGYYIDDVLTLGNKNEKPN